MAFNLRRKKTAISSIPPMGDVAYNPDNPMRVSWDIAASKMLPQYQSQDPSITNISDAMTRLGKSPEDVMQEASAVDMETLEDQGKAVDVQNNIITQLQNIAISKSFNLKKSQGIDPIAYYGEQFPDTQEQQPHLEPPKPPFSKVEEFREWADSTETHMVLQQVAGPSGDHLKEAMEQYYASMDEGEKGQIAAQIFSDPSFPLREEQGIMGQPKHFGEVDETIKKLAQTTASEHKTKVFNLKKTAQQKLWIMQFCGDQGSLK